MGSRFHEPAHLEWERRTLERARRGEAQALGELYAVMAPRLRSEVLMPRLGVPAAADEALAETFRTLVEKLGTFESPGPSIWFWLVQIAVNKATDVHRERARTGKALASFADRVGPLLEAIERPDTQLDEAQARAELRTRIEATLGRIPERYAHAIRLRLIEERSRAECAQRLEVTVPTFDVLLLRALRAFRATWDRSPK